MPSTYTPPGDGTFVAGYTHPSDGDTAPVESVNLPMRQLGAKQQFLFAHAALAITQLQLAVFPDVADSKSILRHIYDIGTANHIHDVCWGAGAGGHDEGIYLAVGHKEPAGDANAAMLWWSPDGYSFTPVTTAYTAQFYGCCHGGPGAYGSKYFVMVGGSTDGGRVYTCNDDLSGFANRVTGALTGSYRAAAWNGTVFCVVGDNGSIITASGADLATWTPRTAGSSYAGTFRRVIASGSILVAFGDNGEIQRSTDNGATWTRVHSDAALGSLTQVVVTSAGILVGTNKANTYLIGTSGGTVWTEYTCVPSGGSATVGAVVAFVKLGSTLAAIVETSADNTLMLSFDGGLTWPALSSFQGRYYDYKWRASATNNIGAVLVGGTDNGTSYGAILRTADRAGFHGL